METSLQDMFPDVSPGVRPTSSRVVVQVAGKVRRSRGGIWIPDETADEVVWFQQVAMIRTLGPLAFHKRSDGTPFPEGAWAKVGDIVRIAKNRIDQWKLPTGQKSVNSDGSEVPEYAYFCLIEDLHILGHYEDLSAAKLNEYL